MATWQGEYTLAQYDELIRLASILGFQDDVTHWAAERQRALDSNTDRSPK